VSDTPKSLLNRLRDQPGDGAAWQRFDNLYRPLLLAWLRRYAIKPQDADDLVQQVLHVVVSDLPHFQYDPATGKFRSWLRAILVNRLRDFWRAEKKRPKPAKADGSSDYFENNVNQLEDPNSNLARLWDREHDEHVTQQLLKLIQNDFEPSTWQSFQRLMAGEKAAAIAAELKISTNAVYLAKSSVLKRLRQECEGLRD